MRERNFGLDLLRSAAILLVLFNHCVNYFLTFPKSTLLGDIAGILGVELFFVLSGFLIGRIILTAFAKGLSRHTVKHFYIRRWFRTLPLYYVLLTFFVILGIIVTKKFDLHLTHFVFLQNFSVEAMRFFSVSWSLAIEEWFYLLLPLVLLIAFKTKFLTKNILLFLVGLIVFVTLLRLGYVYFFNPEFDMVRKHAFLRFDSLLMGVLLAGIKMHKHNLYKKLQMPFLIIIPFFFIAMFGHWFSQYTSWGILNTSFRARVLSFPVLSFFIALMIPFLENNALINQIIPKIWKLRGVITWISILSYSVYLIHLTIFDWIKGSLLDKVDLNLIMVISLFATFAVSYLLYRSIEKPFMKMREKFS